MTVAHRQAGRVAHHFPPKFIRRLEPNAARTHNWFLHQTQKPLFLKISLRDPVLTNSREKVLELRWRNRARAGKARQQNEIENCWKNHPHEIIDPSAFEPNLRSKISVLSRPSPVT